MRPHVKSTIVYSVLGFSLALNVAMAIGHLRGSADKPDAPAAHPAGDDTCLLDRLELHVEQQRRLAEMRRGMHEKRTAYWQRAIVIKVELAEAICAAQADRAALDLQLERYAKNQAAMQRVVADHLVDVNAILRPEQREGFRTLLRTEMFRGIHSSQCKPAGAP